MSKETAKTVCKIVSIVLVALSLIMLFQGSLTIADKSVRKSVQSNMKSVIKQYTFTKEELEDYQDTLDTWGVDLSAKKLAKQFKKVAKVVQDAKIAPSELATAGPTFIKLAGEIEDNEELSYFLGGYMDDLLDAVGQVKGFFIAMVILFIVSLAVGAVIILSHIGDKKVLGISCVIISLIWWILFGVASIGINNYCEMELDMDDKIVKMTGAPVWGFILALLAVVVWANREKIANMLGSDNVGMVQPMLAGTNAAPGKFCPNCGRGLSADAKFCNICGTKFEEAPAPAAPAKQFCANCGTELGPDSDFCPNCGTKRE